MGTNERERFSNHHQNLPKHVAYNCLEIYARSTVRQLGTSDPLFACALCVMVGSSPGSVLGTHCQPGDGKVLRYMEGDARELTFAPGQSTWTPGRCGSVLNLNSQPQLNPKPGGPVAWHLRLRLSRYLQPSHVTLVHLFTITFRCISYRCPENGADFTVPIYVQSKA